MDEILEEPEEPVEDPENLQNRPFTICPSCSASSERIIPDEGYYKCQDCSWQSCVGSWDNMLREWMLHHR
jgi:hypothetical protein